MISNQFPTIIYGIINGTIVPIGTLTVGPNGVLVLTPTGSGQAHFDASGNIQVFDPTNNVWRSVTAPGGVLTIASL